MANLPKIFRLVPSKLLTEASNKYLNFANMLNFLVLKLKVDLLQAEIDITPQMYINMALFTSIYFFSIFTLSFITVIFLIGQLRILLSFVAISFSISFFIFFYILFYPRFIATRRIKELEGPLLPALRHVLIKVRSGVPLFQALASLAQGYGELSKEIKILIEKVNANVPLAVALEETAAKNPSVYFRRALLQISTAIKSGADINNTLAAITDSLSKSIIIEATNYGRKLNFWAVIYLVISIIFPAMGLSFLVMLSTFLGLVLNIYTFIIVAIGLVIAQILFLSLINSAKPSMVIY